MPANDTEPLTPLSRVAGFATRYWAQWIVLGSLVSAFVGWIKYDISLLQPLEELAHKQAVYREETRRSELQRQAIQHHLKLAQSFLDVGQLSPAKRELEAVEKLDPGNPEASLGLLKLDVFEPVHDKNYVPDVAERRIRMILERSDEDPHALTFLGDVYALVEEAKAASYYQRAIKKHRGAAAAYEGLGVLLDASQRFDAALPYYEKAVQLSPWNQPYLSNLAYQYLAKGDAERTIQTDRRLLHLNNQYLLAYYSSSIAYRWLDELEMSSVRLDQLLNLLADPDIHGSECNRALWFFHTDSGPVFFGLHEASKRAYYATLGAALTAHLRIESTRRDELLASAAKLEGPNFDQVRRLIRYDAAVLLDRRPERKLQIEAFLKLLERH